MFGERAYRTRPATAPPPCVFDTVTDWCASYAATTGIAHHARDHFIEVYCEAVLQSLRQTAGLPTPEATWKDIKVHGGLRGELQTVFAAARHVSMSLATAASLEQAEADEKRARGARGVSED